MRWFALGGTVMWPLLLCSLAALAVAIERFWYFASIRENVERLLDVARTACATRNYTSACYNIRQQGGPISQIVHTFLVTISEHANQDKSIIEARLTREANKQINRIENNIKVLEVVATVAPLLGLIGTISGIMRSLGAIGMVAGTTKAQILSTGLSEALIGTEFGLIIAAPAIMAHAYFIRRADKTRNAMEQVGNELIEMYTQAYPHNAVQQGLLSPEPVVVGVEQIET